MDAPAWRPCKFGGNELNNGFKTSAAVAVVRNCSSSIKHPLSWKGRRDFVDHPASFTMGWGDCITCGLSVTRGACPVVINRDLRRSLILAGPSYSKDTFEPCDVKLGYFTFGLNGRHKAQFWWHEVPYDAPYSAKCANKKILQAKAIFEGYKVVSAQTCGELQGMVDGEFKDAMNQLIRDMRKRYERNVSAARAALQEHSAMSTVTTPIRSTPLVDSTVVKQELAGETDFARFNT